jgi:hypothetical protein
MWHGTSNNTCKHLPSDSGEHATRQKFQISHYWADLEQCFNLHMPPDIYLSTNLTQRPSATDNENVFKEIRGYPFVSFTASHLSQASQRSAHEATRLSRKDVSRDQKRATNPVSCALVSCHTPCAKDLHCGKYSNFLASYLPYGLFMHGE